MKRLYFKKWIQNTLIIIETILVIALGGAVDTISTPFEIILIIELAIVVISILLAKYGRFEEKEEED